MSNNKTESPKDWCDEKTNWDDNDLCIYEINRDSGHEIKDKVDCEIKIDEESNFDCKKKQLHNHEFQGSTRIAELEEDPHNHRFSGVSSPAIPVPGGHIHKIKSRTDFFDHLHYIEATSGLQISVGGGKHVHFIKTTTSINDFHSHELVFATLIEAPMLKENK